MKTTPFLRALLLLAAAISPVACAFDATAPLDDEEVSSAEQGISGLPIAGDSVSILAYADNRYVSAESAGQSALIASRDQVGSWEAFQIFDQGNGYVALKSSSNGKYVTATNAGTGALLAAATQVGAWELFQWEDLGSGDFALRAKINGKYVSADNYGNNPLIANRDQRGQWETFHWAKTPVPSDVVEGRINIFAYADDRFVTAENAGQSALIANRTHPSTWESFEVSDAGEGYVQILAVANDNYIRTTNAGSGPLLASQATNNKADASLFRWVDLGNGNFALRSKLNGLYVTAENGGQSALVASRAQIGEWETFRWQPTLERKFAPRLRFDGAAPNYPMSADSFWRSVVDTGLRVSVVDNEDPSTLADDKVPTYFQVTRCGNQTRIMYWWFYAYQYACDSTGNGTHNGDWENVMVTLSEDMSRVAAVTYWAHGHNYTRLAERGGIHFEDGHHAVVYVGKTTHASYYNQGGSGTCAYWEDYRNNTSGVHLDSWRKLVDLNGDDESWIAEDRKGGFAWGPDGVNTHPTTHGPTCQQNACSWKEFFDTDSAKDFFTPLAGDAFNHSQCKLGDDDDGMGCVSKCESGYTQFPLTCSKCEGKWYDPTSWDCDTYSRHTYGYDYTLPTNDRGLLHNDPK